MSTQFILTAPGLPPDAPDPRHAPIREFIQQMQRDFWVPEQWDGRCAKALSVWLKANPRVTVDEVEQAVRNRFDSAEPAGDPPHYWIPKLTKYWEGPLDRYGKVREYRLLQQKLDEIPRPKCPLDFCDGTGWWVDRQTRQPHKCECDGIALQELFPR